MASRRSTGAWLRSARVGQVSSRNRWAIAFEYGQDTLDAYPLNTPVLSCSLPLGRGRSNARAFFAGLLPEGDHRRMLAAQAGCLPTDVFALLARFGQDVAGAIVVGEAVAERPHAAALPYTADAFVEEITELGARTRPLALHDDSELSIAGLQDKMLLVRLSDGAWARPVHGYPSTHILKIDDRAHRGLVIAEHTCLQIAAAAGIPAASTDLTQVGGVDCLIVERFDRRTGEDGWPERIHQEDACQALGVDLETGDGLAKYEAHGGPSLHQVAALLQAWSLDPHAELGRLLEQVVFTVVTGNADAHGKNISLLHEAPGQVGLAPLYDTVPTVLWPTLRTRAAMSVGAAVDLPTAGLADLVSETRRWGMAGSAATTQVYDCLERIRSACSEIEQADAPIAAATVHQVRTATERLLSAATAQPRRAPT